MTADHDVPAPTTRVPLTERAARWCGTLAVVASLFAAVFLVQWGNRIYIARSFFADEAPGSADVSRFSYALLASAHDALLSTFVSVLLAVGLVMARTWLRRRGARQRSRSGTSWWRG